MGISRRMRLPIAFKVSIARRAVRLLIVYLMTASLRSLSSASETHPTMKRISSSPATGVVAGSDTHSDKKQRTTQENGSTTTAMPTVAEKTTTETIFATAASDETTGEGTPAAPDAAGYVSNSLRSDDSDDDSSISDSVQWPPDDDEENLPHQDQQPYLCSSCRQIDFDEIFSRHSLEQGGDPILSFSDEQKVLRDPECAFCQAMQFIYPSLDMQNQSCKQYPPLVAATFDTSGSFGMLTSLKPQRVVTYGKIVLTFTQNWYGDIRRIKRWERYMDKSLLTYGCDDNVGYLAEEQTIDSDYKALPAASVKPHVDLDLIKRKLDECRDSHSTCRKSRRAGVLGMRLIDCKSRTVVPAPQRGFTYAALSYVWGTPQSISESGPMVNNCHEELPADLPNTIADAMLVALRLKIRYLWCDRYCIRQNPRNKEEAREKHGQIARMCDIYSGASITIIAAAGDGPDYGLPGVSKKRRPPRVRVGSHTLFATFGNPKALIDCSRWSTRGWTFQEGLLTRRCLVFTDQQIYFQCQRTGTFEAYDRSGEMSVSLDSMSIRDSPVYPYFSFRNNCSGDIWNKIDSYARLELGNTQDILNAFLGILKHYEESPLKDFHIRNVAGLPIDTRFYFDAAPRLWPSALISALAWECDFPGRRRDGFPSWSWIGWYCRGYSRNEYSTTTLPKRMTRSSLVSVEGPNDELLEHDELHNLFEARYDFSQVKFICLTAPSLKARVIPTSYHLTSRHKIFDNNEGKLIVRYPGFVEDSVMNLSEKRFLDVPLPSEGIQCFSIIINEDREDIPFTIFRNFRDGECATTLVVVEKDGGFERIGVSYVYYKDIRRIGSTVREFRLM